MKLPRHLASTLLVLTAGGPGFSQSAPAPRPPAAAEPAVVLSPFEVRSEEQGYGSTASTTASRVAVPITDISTSVISINEKLIEDTLAIKPDDTLNLVGGVSTFAETQSQEANRFSLRGYTSSSAQRDGFTDVLYGSFGGFNYTFVERMEVLKGPNGILYGDSNPGGILNLVSKKPLPKPRTRVSLMGGSFGLMRGDLDTSGFVDQKRQFGYRLATSYMRIDGPLDHPADMNKDRGFFAINPVVRYRTKNDLEIWAWTGFVRDYSPRLNPTIKGFRSPDGKGAYLAELEEGGGGKPHLTNLAKVETDSYEVGITKSLDLGKARLDLRTIARYSDQLNSSTFVTATGGIDVYVNRAGAIIGRDSRTIDYSQAVGNVAGIFRSVGLNLTGNNVVTKYETFATDLGFTFNLGPVENRLLVFGTYDQFNRDTLPGTNGRVHTITGAANLARVGADLVGGEARIWLYPMSREAMAGISPATIIANATASSAQNLTLQESEIRSFGASERMLLWDKRAVVVGGVRYSDNDSVTQTGTAAAQPTVDKVWTTSFGAVLKAYRGDKGTAALFYNANESFLPVFTIDRRRATNGQKFPNRFVQVREVGLKLDLFKSKLIATGSVYRTKETNVLLSFVDVDGSITGETNRTYQVPAGKGTIDGWDLDLAYHATRELDIVASYGRTDARLSTGLRTIGHPSATASALTRYEVQTGRMKNLSFAWNYTWWGDSMLDSRTNWTIPAGYVHNVILGYRWKNIGVRLRVDNVLDELKARPSTQETAVGVTTPRSYRVSLDYRW
ncbi:MAG: TonB-dependent receptor [Opitutus sp.]|nr:TonB-dependent receptor [Opitutus sp.]